MNLQHSTLSLIQKLALLIGLAIIVSACAESTNPNVTPTVDLTILVTNTSASPMEDARVYLFPFQTQYDSYLSDNPNGDEAITPSLGADDIGVTNSAGEVTFRSRPLEGNSYASGETWFHRPNSVYIRVESPDGSSVLTNDQGLFKISFDEIEAGERIAEFVEIEVK